MTSGYTLEQLASPLLKKAFLIALFQKLEHRRAKCRGYRARLRPAVSSLDLVGLTSFFAWCLLKASDKVEKKYRYDQEYKSKNREQALVKMRNDYRDNQSIRDRKREYRQKNRERDRIRDRKNREQILAKQRIYRQKNREKINAQSRITKRARLQRDPAFRLRLNLGTRISTALRGVCKSARTLQLVGCTIPELVAHLEKQFQSGKAIDGKFFPSMAWENYGPVWHVDHIRPCAVFNLADPAQQKECFHYTNLQPLFAPENAIKGDKIL